jgi:hypothetical protein
MRAQVYRGPYRIPVEDEDIPPIEFVRVPFADVRHQLLDPVVVVGPYVAAAGVATVGVRSLVRSLRGGVT